MRVLQSDKDPASLSTSGVDKKGAVITNCGVEAGTAGEAGLEGDREKVMRSVIRGPMGPVGPAGLRA